MLNLYSIKNINNIIENYNFKFSKSLGQNFLINPSIIDKIVNLSGISSNSGVIEIGPGFGVLTQAIAKVAKKVIAVEIDKSLIPILYETLNGLNNVTVINNDILKIDMEALINSEFPNMDVSVCANLPYYLTTPIIMGILEKRLKIDSINVMVQKEAIIMGILEKRLKIDSINVMVQKEVAKKMCTYVGHKDSSALTFGVNYYSKPKILFNVSNGNFIPKPKVDSSVIKLEIKKNIEYDVMDEKFLFKVVHAGFNNRRKILLNALSCNLDVDKVMLLNIFNKLGIDVNIRAERMSIKDFVNISNSIIKLK